MEGDADRLLEGVRRAFRFMTLVWLLWLAYPVADLLRTPRPPAAALGGWLLLLAFLAAYLRLMLSDPFVPWSREAARLFPAIVILSLAAPALLGQGWGGLPIFAATAAGAYLAPNLRALLLIAGIAVADALAMALHDAPPDLLIVLPIVALGVGVSVMGTRRLLMLIHELRAARAAVAALAVVRERERFARDLHDLLGHSLSLIALKSGLASRLLQVDPARASREIRDVEHVARDALGEVRDAVEGYRDADLGRELARAQRTLAAADVRAEVCPEPGDLPAPVAAALGWVVREGVMNVVRHAAARHCRVELRVRGPLVELEVADDGRGSLAVVEGSGLTGLRERLSALGGRLEAGRAPGGGFRLLAALPAAAP